MPLLYKTFSTPHSTCPDIGVAVPQSHDPGSFQQRLRQRQHAALSGGGMPKIDER